MKTIKPLNDFESYFRKLESEGKVTKYDKEELSKSNEEINEIMEETKQIYHKMETLSLQSATKVVLYNK